MANSAQLEASEAFPCARKQRSTLLKLEAGSVPKVQGTVPRVAKLRVPCPQGTIGVS